MPIDITMPALSPTMTEGKLSKWLKKEGDQINPGDVIAEIETDKATMEIESADEGKLTRILVKDGAEGVKVGEVIGILLGEGEDAAVPAKRIAAPTAPQPAPIAVATAPATTAAAVAAPRSSGERLFASPLAKSLAVQGGIDLTTVTGSGPHGRIVKSDIEAAIAKGPTLSREAPSQATPVAAPPATPSAPIATPASPTLLSKERVGALAGDIPYQLEPHTGMRRAIAKRLTEAKQTVPHFYLTIDCNIDRLSQIRAELNERAGNAFKLSVNDFVIRAAALALRKVPRANASWSDDGTLLWQQIDIAVAVAIDGGLITPIIKSADTKGLGTISNEMKDLGARAKAGKLKLEEFQGGTFSISNLGMFGIKEFSAVINPPQGAILAVGAGEQRPVVKDGALAIATMMSVTLSVDHRVVDGALGATFLQAFKRLIEDPLSMLL